MMYSQDHLCGNFSYKTPADTLKHDEGTVRESITANMWDSLPFPDLSAGRVCSCQWVQICQDHAHVQWEACCLRRGPYAFPQERQTTLWDLKPLQNMRALPATSGVCISYRSSVRAWSLWSGFAYSLLSDGGVERKQSSRIRSVLHYLKLFHECRPGCGMPGVKNNRHVGQTAPK